MGFYIRKSFRAGPIRFNLSKSGLGISAGVRGARIGLTSQGRAYVHGGRHGLYYRQTLGAGSRAGSAAGGGSAAPRGPVELTEDTGVTYASGPLSIPARDPVPDPVRPVRRLHVLPALAAGAAGFLMPMPVPAVALVLAFAALLAQASVRRGAVGAGDRFGHELRLFSESAVSAELPCRAALDEARAAPRLHPDDVAFFEFREYSAAVTAVAAPSAEPRAVTRLAHLDAVVSLPAARRQELRLAAYSRAHLAAVRDHDLTEEEEHGLAAVRAAFGLTAADLGPELGLLDRLRSLRDLRAGTLPSVEPSVPLRSGETCHFEAPARLLRSRVLRSFSRDGVRYKVRGHVVAREGKVVVTDRRVALVHAGETSYPLAKILDVEVDHDRQLVTLVRQGVAAPALITTPDALRAGAVIDALLTAA